MSTSQVALITGSSRGIGRAIAARLASEGFAVGVNYASSEAAAAELVDEIEQAGGQAIAVQGDVGEAADREAMLAAVVDRWGRLDVLVNNAGITSVGRKDLLEATEESWDKVFGVNLKGAFFLSQAAANQMIAQPPLTDDDGPEKHGGKIITISSISAYATSTNRADYCIAKAGLEMMTWLLADRLAEHGITVFDVCPGVIASDMTAPVKEKYDALIADGLSPIRRWGQPEDVAGAVAMLARGELSFCTGQRLHVDGGFHIRRL